MSKDKMMLIEVRCREHDEPLAFLPGIAKTKIQTHLTKQISK